ncbi:MAG TPA: right-handed parallel beta-helix repeat-containing protein [Beijerinckiaceae bacterium]
MTIRVDPGVRARPAGPEPVVATLDEALALLRQRRGERGGASAMTIEMAGGVHRLARPVRIDANLSGRPEYPLTIRGAPDGTTRVTGSVPLVRSTAEPPPGVAPEQRERVVAFQLPQAAAKQPSVGAHRDHVTPSVPASLELFDEGGALVPARWPNEGWARVVLPAAAPVKGAAADPVILVTGGHADRWTAETDLWVAGYLGEKWSFETLPAVSAVRGSGRLALAGTPRYPMRAGDRFFVEHAVAELDAPGEWWRDPGRGLVHLIPRTSGSVEVSVASGLIDIAGASHVRLEGITFERSRGDAVTVSGGENVVLDDCTIRWTGGRGLVIDGAIRSGMRRSVVTDTGDGAVTLTGGDRPRLIPAESFVTDSVLARFGRLGRTYKNAVTVNGVGMRVIGNLIAHAPHFAIRFQGNDHEIAYNEVFDVVNDTSDAGAIYTGRDIAAQGTRLHGNFLHDIRPNPGAAPPFEVKGIYLDDMASGITIENNLFLRVQQPVFIGGGRDNTVTGNAFVASSPSLHIDGRGEVWPSPPITSPDNPVRAAFDAVPTGRPPWSTRYPRLQHLLSDEPLAAKRNRFSDNLLVGSRPVEFEDGADPRRQTIVGNVAKELAGAAEVRTITELRHALAETSVGQALAFDRMDRAATLSRDPRLKRRAGDLLSKRQGS